MYVASIVENQLNAFQRRTRITIHHRTNINNICVDIHVARQSYHIVTNEYSIEKNEHDSIKQIRLHHFSKRKKKQIFRNPREKNSHSNSPAKNNIRNSVSIVNGIIPLPVC